MKFDFIDAQKAFYPVRILCQVLEVSRSGFYASRRRPESARSVAARALEEHIREVFGRSRGRHGSPRIHADLSARGFRVGRNRVISAMKRSNLVARSSRRFRPNATSDRVYPIRDNVLDRHFDAAEPNTAWVTDTTELLIGTNGSRAYLAVVLDLFSRLVVGWSLSATNDRHLTIKALDMALRSRRPKSGLLHHSDRGSTYASADYQARLEERGFVCSMSRRGNCYDNAAMESWFATLKKELGEAFSSRENAQHELFEYIEVFYNQQRRHSVLDYVSPGEFERSAVRAGLA